MAPRRRLDAEMVRRNLVPSRSMAKTEISEGRVTVGGAPALKASRMVDPAEDIQLISPPRFVSRAGQKLQGAIEAFGIDPTGMVCLDAGSSTGGFTDFLLQHGAKSVVAVDVGTHQLHEKIRSDERVQVREQTDIRSVTPESLDRLVDLVVGDLSFISLKLVMPTLFSLVRRGGDLILLVKPQFEAGRREVSRGSGVITAPLVWQRVLTEVWREANNLGGAMIDVVVSPITGRTGNVEFVARFGATSAEPMPELDLQQVVIDASNSGML